MLAAFAISLVLAAPPPAKKVYQDDIRFALKALEENCGHFFKLKGIRWAKVRSEFTKQAKKVKSLQDHYELLIRLVARVRDGHAGVVVPKGTKVEWPDKGDKRGPGMFLCTDGKKFYVKNCQNPAQGAGITPGMEVLKIDGQPAKSWMELRVSNLRDLIGFSTDQQALFFACHRGLQGTPGSRMKLELRRPDRKTKKATLSLNSKMAVPWGPVVFPQGLERTGRQSYGKTQAGFGYIHLRNTPSNLPEQIDAMLAKLGDVPGLILDCRANGGGGTDHDGTFGRFVPPGRTLSFGPKKSYGSAGKKQYIGPMVVIVDAGVRSAGETISGIFKEDGRAYMIGPAPTAGMSSSKRTIELPSKLFSLYVSIASNKGRFNGNKGIEGIGVPPHEIVYYDPKELAEGIDTQIRRAEELLTKGFPRNTVPYKPERFGWKRKK